MYMALVYGILSYYSYREMGFILKPIKKEFTPETLYPISL